MHLLTFMLVYPLIWLLSILPMPVLYGISNVLFYLHFYIIGYRKDVVLKNLRLSFPEKSAKELLQIRKAFFRHFIDFFMESVKTFTISKREISKRMTYKNMEVLDEIVASGKSIALVGIHQANWEWTLSMPLKLKGIQSNVAYTKIGNPYFEKVLKKSRAKFGAKMYKTSNTIPQISQNHKNNVQSIYGLLSDQSPQITKTHYWSEFMGVKVPIHTGAEMLAKKYDLAYVFFSSKKLKRGYYQLEFTLISESPKKHENYTLTDQFLRLAEKEIRENPTEYLWSHNRFKHKDLVPEKFL